MIPDRLKRKQFVYYLALMVPAFTLVGLVLQNAGVEPLVAFAVGIIFSMPAEMYRDWLHGWIEAEETIDELDSSGGSA